MKPYLRVLGLALWHAVFCWHSTYRVPDLALFRCMADYPFPLTCASCGSVRWMTGAEIQERLA